MYNSKGVSDWLTRSASPSSFSSSDCCSIASKDVSCNLKRGPKFMTSFQKKILEMFLVMTVLNRDLMRGNGVIK